MFLGRTVTPMDANDFRSHAHELIDLIANYLENIEDLPISADVAPGDVRRQLPEHPPVAPEAFSDVVRDVRDIVIPGLTHWQHPNFFAYFPGNTTYSGILADLLTAGLGVQGMSWVTSPACTEVETLMLDWMHELLGLPDAFRSTSANGGGVIQGSASEATLVSILSARWRATNGVVNADGDTSKLVAYATSQAHSSIEKGLRVAGIGTNHIRIVPHDSEFAMDIEAFEALVRADIDAGLTPFWVCSTRGTTSSGAMDRTAEIGRVAKKYGLWMHVDGAMHGIAALAPEFRWVNDGMELADSYCTNPHKWMGVNFDCDLYWTADRRSLLGALSILPEYLRSAAAESGAAIDYRDWQIPLGRRFRSLKLWFALRLDGIEVFQTLIRDHVAMAQSLAVAVGRDERFEIVAPHPLNLVCLRLKGDDSLTDRLIESANETRTVLFTRTVLDGRSVLRFSIGSRTTTREHVMRAWELLQRLA